MALLPCSNKQLGGILQLIVVQFEEIFVRTQDKPDLHNTLQLLSIKELFFPKSGPFPEMKAAEDVLLVSDVSRN